MVKLLIDGDVALEKRRERQRIASRKWRAAHPEVARVRRLEYASQRPAYMREYQRRRNGLPAPARPAPDKCECCGNLPGKQAMNLDHCHATGKFRGWLCGKCNPAIGGLGDNLAGIRKALDYLQRANR